MVVQTVRDIRFAGQVRTNTSAIRSLDSRVSQLENRIQQIRGLTEARVNQLINGRLTPITSRLSGAEKRVSNNETAVRDIRAALSATEGRLNARVNQLSNTVFPRIVNAESNIGKNLSKINDLTTRLNSVGGRATTALNLGSRIDLTDLPNLRSRLSGVEGVTGALNMSGIRTNLGNISGGLTAIQSTIAGIQSTVTGLRSGAATNATAASNKFTLARAGINAWAANPIGEIGKGIIGVRDLVLGVFELSAAVLKLIQWEQGIENGLTSLASDVSSQAARFTSLRNAFT